MSYSVELGPPRSTASVRIYMAMAVALRFGQRVPSVEQLQREFGMHRSTAYKWLGAIHAARGESTPPGPAPRRGVPIYLAPEEGL